MSSSVDIPGFDPGDLFLTGNPILVEVTGSGCPADCTDYRLLLKVEADNTIHEGGGTFYDQIIPNASDIAVFDIHGYIDIPVPVGFSWPLSGSVHGYYDRSIGFSVTPGESWIDEDGDLQEAWGSDLGDFFALRGGVSERQLAEWIGETSSFDAEFASVKTLTYRPNPSTVLPNQPVKLWQCWDHGSSIPSTMVVVATFDDGTTETVTVNWTTYTDAVYEFDVQPANLGLVVDDGTRRITGFTVNINGGSETRAFTIDWGYYERPFFLLFQNGLGAVEDVALTGGWQSGYKSSSTTAWQPLPTDATLRSSTVKVTGKTGSRVWSVNTGYKPLAELEQLAGDLLMCRNAWLCVPTAAPESLSDYTLFPVVADVSDITATSWDNDIGNMALTFTEAHDNKYF